MSQQKPNTITLRRLEPGEAGHATDYYVGSYMAGPHLPHTNDINNGLVFREVSPIPDGYEVCDLADATKVLIGDGFRDVDSYCIDSDPVKGENYPTVTDIRRFKGFGILAIRPIPEPMRGESEVFRTTTLGSGSCYGSFRLPPELIGKVIRWEVVKDGGE